MACSRAARHLAAYWEGPRSACCSSTWSFCRRNCAVATLAATMLRLAEEEGVRRGCRSAMLYTISFQAPGFYERHGWHEFGRIPCDPPGTSRIFMTKALPPAAAAD